MITRQQWLDASCINVPKYISVAETAYNERYFMTWSSYQIRKIAGYACAWNAGNVSSATVGSHPDMHRGTCVMHVPWCMPRSLTSGFFWRRSRGKCPRYSRRMCNPLFYVPGQRTMVLQHYPYSCWMYFRKHQTVYAFFSFLNTEMRRVVEIRPYGRQWPVYPTKSILCLQGAKASATILLTYLSWNIPISAPEGVKCRYKPVKMKRISYIDNIAIKRRGIYHRWQNISRVNEYIFFAT